MAMTPEERQKRMDELKAEREKRIADEIAQRAKSDPMFNPAVQYGVLWFQYRLLLA